MTGFPLLCLGLMLACLAPMFGEGLFVAGLLVVLLAAWKLWGEVA